MTLPADDMLSLPEVVAWFRRNWLKLLLGGVVCAALALPYVLLRPKYYESSVTVRITPPAWSALSSFTPTIKSTSMASPDFPMEAYQSIATSATVLDEVAKATSLEGADAARLPNRISVEGKEIGIGTAAEFRSLEMRARMDSPEWAAKTTQTWAEVFVRRANELASGEAKDTAAQLDTLHADVQADMEAAELALATHIKSSNVDLLKRQLKAKAKLVAALERKLKLDSVDLTVESATMTGLGQESADTGVEDLDSAASQARRRISSMEAANGSLLLQIGELEQEIETLHERYVDASLVEDRLKSDVSRVAARYALVQDARDTANMLSGDTSTGFSIMLPAVAPVSPSNRSAASVVLIWAAAGIVIAGVFISLKEISDAAPSRGQLMGVRAGQETRD